MKNYKINLNFFRIFTGFIGLGLLVFTVSGCHLLKKRKWSKKIEKAKETAESLLTDLDLAHVHSNEFEPVLPSTHVVVRDEGIYVDNAVLAAHWWDTHLMFESDMLEENYLDKMIIESRQVVALQGGKIKASDLRDGAAGFLITPLFEALSDAAMEEKIYYKTSGKAAFEGLLTLYMEKNTPFEVVSRVLYTAGQAEYDSFRFAVKSPDGLRTVPVDAPRVCTSIDEDEETADCAEPSMEIMAKGIMVWARRGSPKPGCTVFQVSDIKFKTKLMDALKGLGIEEALDVPLVGEPLEDDETELRKKEIREGLKDSGILKLLKSGSGDEKLDEYDPGKLGLISGGPDGKTLDLVLKPPGPEKIDWRGRLMLGPKKLCPSVPRKGGKLDIEGLNKLIASIKKLAPGCKRAIISAQPPIPLSELIEVAEAAIVQGGFQYIVLSVSLDSEANCEDGIQPEEAM